MNLKNKFISFKQHLSPKKGCRLNPSRVEREILNKLTKQTVKLNLIQYLEKWYLDNPCHAPKQNEKVFIQILNKFNQPTCHDELDSASREKLFQKCLSRTQAE